MDRAIAIGGTFGIETSVCGIRCINTDKKKDLMVVSKTLAQRLAWGPASIKIMKRAINEFGDMPLETTLNGATAYQFQATRTRDHEEAVKAYLEKRKPSFIGGKVHTSEYSSQDKKWTNTSAGGIVATSFIDSQGRVTSRQLKELEPQFYYYDGPGGRLSKVTQGPRETTYDYYTATGFLKEIINPLGRKVEFEYDNVGRPQTQVLYNSQDDVMQTIHYRYDADGNLTRIVPPHRTLSQGASCKEWTTPHLER